MMRLHAVCSNICFPRVTKQKWRLCNVIATSTYKFCMQLAAIKTNSLTVWQLVALKLTKLAATGMQNLLNCLKLVYLHTEGT